MMSKDSSIPVSEAQAAIWKLWETVHEVLTDEDGTQTTHFAALGTVKAEAVRLVDSLGEP